MVGTLVREWRVDRGLSLGGLALKAGVGKSTLSYWEAGKRQPSVAELEAVLAALRVLPEQRAEALARIAAPRAVRRLREAPPHSLPGGPPVGGDLLRAMRFRRGWTQAQTAARVGVRQSAIARWERGEAWPSADHLLALCAALGALEAERAALTADRISLAPPADASPSLESASRRLHALAADACHPDNEPLMDLRFLALEAALWPQAVQAAPARLLLVASYARHAQFLVDRQRFVEAGPYADRALDLAPELVQSSPSVRVPPDWLPEPPELLAICTAARAACVAARVAALGGSRPNPARGARLLQDHLDSVPTADLRAWMLSELAEYVAAEQDLESALHLGEQACRELEDWRGPGRVADWWRANELRLRRRDLARLLIQAGRAAAAVPLLPTDRWLTEPVHDVQEAALWAEALLALGDTTGADHWLREAYASIQTHDLDQLRPQADALARRL